MRGSPFFACKRAFRRSFVCIRWLGSAVFWIHFAVGFFGVFFFFSSTASCEWWLHLFVHRLWTDGDDIVVRFNALLTPLNRITFLLDFPRSLPFIHKYCNWNVNENGPFSPDDGTTRWPVLLSNYNGSWDDNARLLFVYIFCCCSLLLSQILP